MTGRVGWIRFTDAPYMSAPERGEFRRLRDGGAVTTFGVALCAAEGCNKEVPIRVKLYCSEACWRKEEGLANAKEEESEPVD